MGPLPVFLPIVEELGGGGRRNVEGSGGGPPPAAAESRGTRKGWWGGGVVLPPQLGLFPCRNNGLPMFSRGGVGGAYVGLWGIHRPSADVQLPPAQDDEIEDE